MRRTPLDVLLLGTRDDLPVGADGFQAGEAAEHAGRRAVPGLLPGPKARAGNRRTRMTEQVVQALRRHTNHRDLMIVREAVLLDELGISSEALRAALKNLEEERLVEVLSPLPFLVLKRSGKQ